MNRVFLCGVALFFAIVGIALMGGQNQAEAGHRCLGRRAAASCCGAVDVGCAATCQGRCIGKLRSHAKNRCGGSRGRLFGKRRCAGQATDCCGTAVVADCCGTTVVHEGAPTEAEVHEVPPTAEPGGEAPATEEAK